MLVSYIVVLMICVRWWRAMAWRKVEETVEVLVPSCNKVSYVTRVEE